MKLTELPHGALDHMSVVAQDHVPSGLLPPPVNVVDVPTYVSGTTPQLSATPADDYFVIDASAPFQFAQISGFDLAHDHVVIENLTLPNSTWTTLSGTMMGGFNWQETFDRDSNYNGAYINDFGYLSYIYLGANTNGGADGGQVALLGIHTDTAAFVSNNLIVTSGAWIL